ncbi:MAG: hypothetical protein AAF411_10755 [Myxococcota bacterium]
MSGHWRIVWAGCFAALCMAGCGDSLTQVVLQIDSNASVVDLDTVQIEVLGPSGDEVVNTQVPLTAPDSPALPLTFGLVLDESAPGEQLTVRVSSSGPVNVAASARTEFIRGESLTLDLFLDRGCIDVVCPEIESCTAGECANNRIDPETLSSL